MTQAILATGGIDSTALMYMYADKDTKILTVDYGHAAYAIQMLHLNYHCKVLGLEPPTVISARFFEAEEASGLFSNEFELAKAEDPNASDYYDAEKMLYQPFHIEGRNTIMLAYVLAECSRQKIDEVLGGYYYSDYDWEKQRSYKLATADNSPQFIDIMNMVGMVGYSHPTRIRAPFFERRWDKDQIIREGVAAGMDINYTHSCYFPKPCGKCDNCFLRAEAIEKALGDQHE